VLAGSSAAQPRRSTAPRRGLGLLLLLGAAGCSSDARLATAALPRRDRGERNVPRGKPEPKDGGRERGATNALETDFLARNSLPASSDPSAQGQLFPKSCGMVTSLGACARDGTRSNGMVSL